MSKDNETTTETISESTETITKSIKTKEEYEKAVDLLAGSDKNMKAVINHYFYLEEYTSEYLKKYGEEKDIVFDDYISDMIVLDLFLNDVATFIGHSKVLSLTTISKLMKGQLTTELQDKAFMRILKVEEDFEVIKDSDFYDIQIDRSVETILSKLDEKGMEEAVRSAKNDSEQTEE